MLVVFHGCFADLGELWSTINSKMRTSKKSRFVAALLQFPNVTFGNGSGTSTKKKKVLRNGFLYKICYRTGSKTPISALPCLGNAKRQ